MSNAGWYPDPGGESGKYRYWDGSSWSTQLTSNPSRTPQPPAAGSVSTKRKATGWWIAAVAAIVAVALIIWLVIGVASSNGGTLPWDAPNGSPSTNLCTAGVVNSSATPIAGKAGRVSGGHLSFPEQGSPWEAPQADNRVPFGTIAMEQVALDQDNYDGNGHSWVSSILVSDLVSGDGFATPKAAAEVVLKCVLGEYYSDNVVTPTVLSAKSHTVDGHKGWLIEAQLSFDITGLKATGERVLLLVVQVSSEQFGLFYASIPDTSPDRLPEARKALADVTVDK